MKVIITTNGKTSQKHVPGEKSTRRGRIIRGQATYVLPTAAVTVT